MFSWFTELPLYIKTHSSFEAATDVLIYICVFLFQCVQRRVRRGRARIRASAVIPSALAAALNQTMIRHVPPASITFTRTAALRPARRARTSLKVGAASPWTCVPVFTYPVRSTLSSTMESVCPTAHPDSPEMRLRGMPPELDVGCIIRHQESFFMILQCCYW